MELRVCAAWGLTFQVGVHSWLEAFGFGGKDARLEPNQSLRTLNPRPQTLEPARSPGLGSGNHERDPGPGDAKGVQGS